MVFIEISSKTIKVGVTFIFRHLVDVMAHWYTSNVFESSLNNLQLFFSMPSNSVLFYSLSGRVLVQAYCFLACAGPVENLR